MLPAFRAGISEQGNEFDMRTSFANLQAPQSKSSRFSRAEVNGGRG
jgi:hypothetical protein